MVVVPAPTMVTVLPAMVATAPFELVYVISPSLVVVGGPKLKFALPNALDKLAKLVRTGVPKFTCNNAVIVPDV